MRAAAVFLLAISLGCSGLLTPSGTIVEHDARCGVVDGLVVSDGIAATLPLRVDGAHHVDLQLLRGQAPFALGLGPGVHTLQVGGGPPVEVRVPANDLELRVVSPSQPPLEGEPVALAVQVLGSCPTEHLEVETTVEASGAQRRAEVQRPSPQRVVLGTLAEGAHDVTVRLVDGEVPLAEAVARVRVAPPCRSGPCRDRDQDGYEGLSVGGTDCDDTHPAVFPGAAAFPDPDGDGAFAFRPLDLDCDGSVDVPPGPFDCAEGDPRIPRGEEPLPTGVDEDCDGLVDEGTTAFDDDGDGVSEDDGDCNDADVTVAPDRPELPDCKDNDCDGTVDDGVTRPAVDDEHEPNDDRPYVLAGAKPRRSPFGGYRPTEDRLALTVRGVRDVESFSLYAHDGAGDTFHVTARLLSVGDGLVYRVSIEGPRGVTEDLLGAGGVLRHGGRAFDDDSGTYVLRIEPDGETPTYCPLVVELTSG